MEGEGGERRRERGEGMGGDAGEEEKKRQAKGRQGKKERPKGSFRDGSKGSFRDGSKNEGSAWKIKVSRAKEVKQNTKF